MLLTDPAWNRELDKLIYIVATQYITFASTYGIKCKQTKNLKGSIAMPHKVKNRDLGQEKILEEFNPYIPTLGYLTNLMK